MTQYKIYRCEWKYGDVYAYRMESELAKEKGLYGRYLLIQKIDEGTWYPGHVVPIVYAKITKDTSIPECIEEYNNSEYVQVGFSRYEERFWPIDMTRPQEDIAEKSQINYQVDEYGFLPQYRLMLVATSKRMIPTNLIYVGNYQSAILPQKEFIPHSKINILSVFWEKFGESFEDRIIKLFCGHNLRGLDIYKKTTCDSQIYK